ncbi:MAG: hypothetical protein QF718_05475 [Phycisphaerales bacterium]|jgi:hypothetical protein|nr:hypothetical protein [Phycisphaerales bacterium]
MVIQIKGTTSGGCVQMFRNRHTGQDVFRHRRRPVAGPRVRQTRIPTHLSIEIDEALLTGNLDEDLSILQIK